MVRSRDAQSTAGLFPRILKGAGYAAYEGRTLNSNSMGLRGRGDLEEVLQAELARVFLKLDSVAFGLSVRATAGLLLFLATLFLVIKGGEVVVIRHRAERRLLRRLFDYV